MSRRIPDVAELRGPCGNLFERLGIEPVEAVAAGATRCDQPAAPQHGQMPGERGLRHAKRGAEVGHRKLPQMQPLKDASARGVSHRSKDAIVINTPHNESHNT